MHQNIAEQSIKILLSGDEFSRWLGIEVKELAQGRAVLQMKVRKEMLNGFGICHGGITFSLADSALAFASNSYGKAAYSIESSIFYNEKIFEGDELTASASEVMANKKTAAYNVIVKKNGEVLAASFKGIVYRTEKKLVNE